MMTPLGLYEFFQQNGVDFYTGVPDSLLKPFLKYIQDHADSDHHIITANEGLAIGLASGYHLATGQLPLVYLQNSGLGNMVNPLTSLADKEMYAIPMLLLIGWRGKPGNKDEPQHVKMGRITVALLEAMEIPFYELKESQEQVFEQIKKAIDTAKKQQCPVALLAGEDFFEDYKGSADKNEYELEREKVVRNILLELKGDEMVVCTTGKSGREFYEQNQLVGNKIQSYLLCAGAMGHASHIALGVHLHSDKKVIMLDGDGALLMHLGALPLIGRLAGENFIHILINNGSHESVGGQPTGGFSIDFCTMAKSAGYHKTLCITGEKQLSQWIKDGLAEPGPWFVEIRTNNNSRKDLGRPAGKPVEWKNAFMNRQNPDKAK